MAKCNQLTFMPFKGLSRATSEIVKNCRSWVAKCRCDLGHISQGLKTPNRLTPGASSRDTESRIWRRAARNSQSCRSVGSFRSTARRQAISNGALQPREFARPAWLNYSLFPLLVVITETTIATTQGRLSTRANYSAPRRRWRRRIY